MFDPDETIERRSGPRIAAKGVYQDAVHSSHSHFVKAMGLRWLSLMRLIDIPWALPFLTILALSARYHAQREGHHHKTLTHWVRQMLACLHHWLPNRELVVVADRTYAALPAIVHHGRRGLVPVSLAVEVTFQTVRIRMGAQTQCQ